MSENHLDLCIKHKQEWKQSHFAEHNCDYCKAERRFSDLIADLERQIHEASFWLSEVDGKAMYVEDVQAVVDRHKRAK